MEEEMYNGNEAETNELGRTKRSTKKAGLSGKGTMGALEVLAPGFPTPFNIGTGFDADDRKYFWGNREALMGKFVKYKYFPIGTSWWQQFSNGHQYKRMPNQGHLS